MKLFKKWKHLTLMVVSAFCLFYMAGTLNVQAEEDRILSGVFVENMDMSGLTKDEAKAVIEAYVQNLLEDNSLLHIQYEDIAEDQPTGASLGGYWSNVALLDELMQLGKSGHVVDRYKFLKDLEREPANYEIAFAFDQETIAAYIEKTFHPYDQEVKNVSLLRKDKAFEIVDGVMGYEVNIDASAKEITDYLNTEWDCKEAFLPLTISVVAYKGSAEELAQVTDLIGSFSSTFAGGTSEKVTNITNGAKLINAVTMYPGEDFSFDAYAAPYTIDNGYAVGKAYESGKLVDSVGGGICQVSSTLYNAVLRAELEITMRYNHSMIVGYVPISSDATLAETSGKDFRFKNNLDAPIYIESYVTKDHKLIVNIYGKETRPSNRTVEYESETVEVINPGPDIIYVDGTKPVGEILVSSAYTGYKAKLWKVVKIDGVEKSRELVNSSNYRAVARMATVGMYTTNPAVLNEMNAAVATGNIDHIQNVIAAILAPPKTED